MTARQARAQAKQRRNATWAALGLVAAVALCYSPVLGNGFVDWDDDLYVYENAPVLRGLGLDGLRWAFSSFHTANWHPLTWLSHQLDVSLFGPGPLGPHLVNVVLHAANSVLCLALFWRTTGLLWPAVAVAALFALHPLRVESVAWISERKDLLCALFGLLSMHAYVRYAARQTVGRYVLVFSLFALGLLAKPMLVTLPLVLLLLDHWPLRRTESEPIGRLVFEKLPLLALSLASSAISLIAARAAETLAALEGISVGERLATAAVAYATYLAKTLWPVGLACLYPHPALGPEADTLFARSAAAGVLLGRNRLDEAIGHFELALREDPDYAVAHNNLGNALFRKGQFEGAVRHYRHALDEDPLLKQAHNNLGSALVRLGQLRESTLAYEAAVDVDPDWAQARVNLGNAYARLGRLDPAREQLRRALALRPREPTTYTALARVLVRQGRLRDAVRRYEEALALDPGNGNTRERLEHVRTQIGEGG